jgi:hypothetical protein
MSKPCFNAAPIAGVVYPRSTIKTFGLILLAMLFFPVGCFLVWAKIRTEFYGPGPGGREITWYGLLLGIVGVVGAPIMVYQLARSLWVRRRLVIGADRLQILECRGSDDLVVMQIPFANIMNVQYDVTTTERRVAIDLLDPDDAESYGDGADFRVNANILGRHYCITEAFRGGAAEIAAEIQKTMKIWQATKTNEPKATRRANDAVHGNAAIGA